MLMVMPDVRQGGQGSDLMMVMMILTMTMMMIMATLMIAMVMISAMMITMIMIWHSV